MTGVSVTDINKPFVEQKNRKGFCVVKENAFSLFVLFDATQA